MARLNILDYMLRHGSEGEVEMARSLVKAKPLLALIPVKGVQGYLYQTTEVAARPTSASRSTNEGVASKKATSVPRSYKLSQWQERSEVDKAIIDGLTAEEAAEERFIQDTQIAEAITDDFLDVAINGSTTANPKDFDGFQTYASTLNGNTGYVSNNSPICLSAGGSSNLTSVYAFKFSGAKGAELLYNSNVGVTPQVTDMGLQLVSDGTNDFAAHTSIVSWAAGMTYPNASIGRIANVEDGSSNTITAGLISKLKRYMGGIDLLVMNRNIAVRVDDIASSAIDYTASDGTLATSIDTAYGIPLVVSDAVTQTESVVS